MIKLKCSTPDTALVTDMVPFQGDLKKRTANDIEEMAQTLKDDGLLMPFALWRDDDVLRILDGHGRFQAIAHIAMSDPSVLVQKYPYIAIEATTEDEARKALLQITSTYGKISRQGVLNFAATVIDYKAPVLQRAVTVAPRAPKPEDRVTVRLSVAKAKVAELTQLLRQVDGIEVL